MRQAFGIIAIAAVAAVAWMAVNRQPQTHGDEQFTDSFFAAEPPSLGRKLADSSEPSEPRSQPLQPEPLSAAAPEADSDPGLIEFAQWKYSYLLADQHAMERHELRGALLQREQLAVAINTAVQAQDAASKANLPELRSQLLQADERVRQLLHPDRYADYRLLKDADAELHRLREYAGGISNLAPLLPEQERAILFAKLTYKQHYDQLLEDSGLEGTELPAPQRLYAYQTLARELETYRNNFLLQARQSLHSEAQYLLLQNYENTEFEAQLARLHQAAVAE
jgi:hypothetical protein